MAWPLISTPNTCNLNCNYMICSVHVFMAINSPENVIDSTNYCWLLWNITGTLFTNITHPVCNIIFLFSNECDAYTNAHCTYLISIQCRPCQYPSEVNLGRLYLVFLQFELFCKFPYHWCFILTYCQKIVNINQNILLILLTIWFGHRPDSYIWICNNWLESHLFQ